MNKHHTAGGIVVANVGGERKYLTMLQRNMGKLEWVSPKGHIEHGETSEMAAAREITEETGLESITNVNFVGFQEYSYYIDGIKHDKIVDWYLFTANNPAELVPNAEEGFIEAKWLSYSEVSNTFTHLSFIPFLEKAEFLQL